MAGSTKDAWEQVGDKFGAWGKILVDHYKERAEEQGGTTEEDRKKLEEAVSTVTRQLDQAFGSLGDTLRDPEAKKGLADAGRALADALTTTVDEAEEKIRAKFGSRESGEEGEEGDASTGTTGSDEPEPPRPEGS